MSVIPSPKKAISSTKSLFAHPIALFLFGMVFAAFLFPAVSRILGQWKAKGGVVGAVIPQSFTSNTTGV